MYRDYSQLEEKNRQLEQLVVELEARVKELEELRDNAVYMSELENQS